MKIFINGFGRIGRCVLRAIIERYSGAIEVVGINDPANWEILAYLLEHDSTHRLLANEVIYHSNKLIIDTLEIPTFNTIQDLKGVDVLIECSGKFLEPKMLENYLLLGAKKVILSAPFMGEYDENKYPTLVYGINHTTYKNQNIISNASCTTNAIAPICAILDKAFHIQEGTLTTIHSYTSDQHLIDLAHHFDKRRSRAAASNIIPTTTKAALALHKVLPNLKNKMHGHSVRVPSLDVSMIDLSLSLEKKASKELLNDLLRKASKGGLKGVLDIDLKERVSSDFISNPHSVIVATDLTFTLENMVKIMAWYDNEWGYSNRLIDMAQFVHNYVYQII
ncbi:type I glyceraldehyde-3-phosphate dehydrogenase [Helicobacter cetorum]|uniref:Glyceraldehyde-3-phosphate dehydrogenase n=1 Tax=Helicobacter cetorum (strain ATCC BAA-540 / CCUG 52418 / MIT 99-5656) TaxID=1163745 RepID=I0ETA8_HELCM|nr:type I glyceraldehyde-3-phosphate dehydrogenase [Helicobacter cetorum]AFI06177.1 glyceraldehyde-3-phosphate dehydrogenase [Helicobacter cetorum MIT 99-5656]